jgi:hypothetical protein
MTKTSNRKNLFILGLLGVMVVCVAFLVLRDIPAPQSEQVIKLDSANVIK